MDTRWQGCRHRLHRIPALKDAGVRSLLNGPEAFTPDTEPLLDEAPGMRGWVGIAIVVTAGIVVGWNNERAARVASEIGAGV